MSRDSDDEKEEEYGSNLRNFNINIKDNYNRNNNNIRFNNIRNNNMINNIEINNNSNSYFEEFFIKITNINEKISSESKTRERNKNNFLNDLTVMRITLIEEKKSIYFEIFLSPECDYCAEQAEKDFIEDFPDFLEVNNLKGIKDIFEQIIKVKKKIEANYNDNTNEINIFFPFNNKNDDEENIKGKGCNFLLGKRDKIKVVNEKNEENHDYMKLLKNELNTLEESYKKKIRELFDKHQNLKNDISKLKNKIEVERNTVFSLLEQKSNFETSVNKIILALNNYINQY